MKKPLVVKSKGKTKTVEIEFHEALPPVNNAQPKPAKLPANPKRKPQVCQ